MFLKISFEKNNISSEFYKIILKYKKQKKKKIVVIMKIFIVFLIKFNARKEFKIIK